MCRRRAGDHVVVCVCRRRAGDHVVVFACTKGGQVTMLLCLHVQKEGG